MTQAIDTSDPVTISYNKATGEKLGETPVDSAETFRVLLDRARRAQKEWQIVPVSQRAAFIRRLCRFIHDRCDELALTISRDNGKTRVDALVTKIFPAAMAASYYANHTKNT